MNGVIVFDVSQTPEPTSFHEIAQAQQAKAQTLTTAVQGSSTHECEHQDRDMETDDSAHR